MKSIAFAQSPNPLLLANTMIVELTARHGRHAMSSSSSDSHSRHRTRGDESRQESDRRDRDVSRERERSRGGNNSKSTSRSARGHKQLPPEARELFGCMLENLRYVLFMWPSCIELSLLLLLLCHGAGTDCFECLVSGVWCLVSVVVTSEGRLQMQWHFHWTMQSLLVKWAK
jgi:hypothetical protein